MTAGFLIDNNGSCLTTVDFNSFLASIVGPDLASKLKICLFISLKRRALVFGEMRHSVRIRGLKKFPLVAFKITEPTRRWLLLTRRSCSKPQVGYHVTAKLKYIYIHIYKMIFLIKLTKLAFV